jgi:transcriptional regulator with XRE-family HTH domain
MSQSVDTASASVEAVLRALGQRLKAEKRRWEQGGRRLTDAELARAAGVARATITRLWQGHPVGTDTLVRVLRALNRLELLAPLLAEAAPTPLERLEGVARPRRRRRATAPAVPPDFSQTELPLADAAALRARYAPAPRPTPGPDGDGSADDGHGGAT